MSVMDLFSVLLYFAITTCLGVIVLRGIRSPKPLYTWSACYLTGQVTWLLIFLIGHFLSIPVNYFIWFICVIAPVIAITILIIRNSKEPENAGTKNLLHKLLGFGLIVILCSISFPQLFVYISRVPLIEWDARSIWFFHAKALWIHNGIQTDFFTNQNFAFWAHLDYPLLLPVQSAVIGVFRGAWSEMAAKGFLFFNFIAYLSLLQQILVRRGWQTVTSWFLAIPIMGIALPAYLNGYADNHYAMPLMLVMLLVFQQTYRNGDLALAGLLIAFALNTKNEVVLYLLMGVTVWLLYLKIKNNSNFKNLKPNLCWWGMLILGLLPFTLWSIFKTVHNIEGDLHLSSRLLTPLDSLKLCLQRAPDILRAMRIVHMQIHSHLLLGIVALIYFWRAYLRQHTQLQEHFFSLEERFLWILFLMAHLMIFAVYALTPYNLNWHLGTSINRLILLPTLILIALLINAIESIMSRDRFVSITNGS